MTAIDATAPIAPPIPAPMTVFFPALPGTVILDETHPGGGPAQPGGTLAVSVLEPGVIEWPIAAPMPTPASGAVIAATVRTDPGSLMAYPSSVTSVIGPGICVT